MPHIGYTLNPSNYLCITLFPGSPHQNANIEVVQVGRVASLVPSPDSTATVLQMKIAVVEDWERDWLVSSRHQRTMSHFTLTLSWTSSG